MWFFSSPAIVFGESSLSYLSQVPIQRAYIVSDANLAAAGLVKKVIDHLPEQAQIVGEYCAVEPDPTLETAVQGARLMLDARPDWILAIGGGSVIDAAKAMWILYERPDMQADAINPVEVLGLRKKARLIALPTTVGTGSEATWATVLTDPRENRKLGLGNRECLPDIAILDPIMVQSLPLPILIDTALDALTHAIEGYTSTWHNVFSDGLCLKAAEMICATLPCCVSDPNSTDYRADLQNAATIAGLGFGNSMAALAHGMGHALGGIFHIAHGKAVPMFLPYTIDYSLGGEHDSTRYRPLAALLSLPASTEQEAGANLAVYLRELMSMMGQPGSIAELGIPRHEFEANMSVLVDNALNDTQTIMGTRIPDLPDLEKLFRAAYDGRRIDF